MTGFDQNFKKGRAIADPAFSALKASFVSRHNPVR